MNAKAENLQAGPCNLRDQDGLVYVLMFGSALIFLAAFLCVGKLPQAPSVHSR